jgi:hypothetical protein
MMDEYIIHPTKNAAGEFDGSMNFDPELLTFGEIKCGRHHNMRYISMLYDGKSIKVETPEMTVPAGVVQYPAPDDVGKFDKVSYALLMSFAGLEDRPDLCAYMDFLKTLDDKVLDMVNARSTDIYVTRRERTFLAEIQMKILKSGGATYADSTTISLPYSRDKPDDVPRFITYDYDKVESGAPLQDSIIADVRDCNTKHAKVKVIYPLSSVWVTQCSFGIATKAIDVLIRPVTM